MSNLSDSELVKSARQGDESAVVELMNRCQEVKDYHLLKYRRMYFGRLNHFDVEDLISECNIAILDAIKQYDVKVPHTFATYAKYAIRNRILNFLNRKIAKHVKSLDPDYDLTLVESTASSEHSKLNELINKNLTGRDKRIIEMYLDGETNVDIGKKLGLTKARIGQIIKACIERMK